MNKAAFPTLIDRVVHFRWIESLLILGQVDRAWHETRSLLQEIDLTSLPNDMQAVIKDALALDRHHVQISEWDLLKEYLSECKAVKRPVVGVRIELNRPGFFFDNQYDPLVEPLTRTVVWHAGQAVRKTLCYRKGFSHYGMDVGHCPGEGAERHEIGDRFRPLGLATFSKRLWHVHEFERHRGLLGVAFQSSLLLLAIAVNSALRDTLRSNGLPLAVPIVFANDHNAPEFTAPVAVRDEYRRDIEGNFRLPQSEPVLSLPDPDHVPDPDHDLATDERTVMFANLLSGPHISEYEELAGNRAAKIASFELKRLHFPDYRPSASGGDDILNLTGIRKDVFLGIGVIGLAVIAQAIRNRK
jgi:hypothetical protein